MDSRTQTDLELVGGVLINTREFEKLVNNRIVDHLEKCGLFSDFQHGFRSSQSTANLLTVASDRIARAFNRSGATQTLALDISKTFGRIWHAGLLHKLKSYGISGQTCGIISFFLSNGQLQVVLDGKSSQELMLEFLKAPFFVLHFSCYTLMTFLIMLSVILLSMLMILLLLSNSGGRIDFVHSSSIVYPYLSMFVSMFCS